MIPYGELLEWKNLLRPKKYLAIKNGDMDGSVIFELVYYDRSPSKFVAGLRDDVYHYRSLDDNNYTLVLDRDLGEYKFREENEFCGKYRMFCNDIKIRPNEELNKDTINGTFYKDLESAKAALLEAKTKGK